MAIVTNLFARIRLNNGRGLWMRYRFNVSCSETNSKNWTPTAIDCYLLGCACSKCSIYKFYFMKSDSKCKMKDTVIELVRKLGAPKEGLENYGKY